MNLSSVLVLSVLCLCFVTSESAASRKKEIDLVIEGLEDQPWQEEEKQCLDDTLLVMNNVKNYTVWAMWIWNSIQHPTGNFYGSQFHLGNYDQCINAPSNVGEPKITTQYCLTEVKLTKRKEEKYGKGDVLGPTETYLNVKNKVGRKSDTIFWGVCLPASCDHGSVVKIAKSIYFANPITSIDPDLRVDSCQKADEKTEYSFRFFVFIAIILTFVVVAVASSIYLEMDSTDTRLTRIAYAFSVKRNYNSLIRTSDEDIPVLSFSKTLVVVFTTVTHIFVFVIMTNTVYNGFDLDNLISVKDYTYGNLVQHIDLPEVENFFIISGLLLMKGLMEKKRDPFIALIQRYIRLIGSLALLVFYTIAVSQYTGDGPMWKSLNSIEQKACEKNWFLSLLLLHNYVDNQNICQLVTWYIPCDYQLAVLGTILFCIWQWDRTIGKITTGFTLVFTLLIPGIVTYWRRLPGILLHDVDRMINIRSNPVYLEIYMKSHHRATPYLLGMGMGYILMKYKPAKYRGVISKEISYLGLATAFIIGYIVIVAAPAWCLGEYNAWNAAVYAALNRNIWAVATIACIALTEYGDVPKLRDFMASPWFSIPSRLAYGIYITHSAIIQRNLFSLRSPMQYDMVQMILNGTGVLIASAILAVFLWVFVESPISNLANLVLVPKKKQPLNGNKSLVNGYSNTEKTKTL